MPAAYLELFQNPYMMRGFRPVPSRVAAIARSVLELHNQTVNIWTHLFALAVFAGFLYETLAVDEFFAAHATPAHRVAHALFLLSVMYTFVVSVVFHSCNCHSVRTYERVAFLDFSGVFVIIVASTLACIYYGYACDPGLRTLYLTTAVLLYGVLSVAGVLTRVHWLRVAIAAFLTSVVPVTLLSLWTLHRGSVTQEVWVVGWKFLFGFLLYGMAFFFYTSKFPERWYPRLFDIFGASHQLWHVFGILAAFWQYHCLHFFYRYYFEDHETRCAAIHEEALYGSWWPQHYVYTWFDRLYETVGWV